MNPPPADETCGRRAGGETVSGEGVAARLPEKGGRRLAWLCGMLLAVVALWNCREVLTFDFVARDDDINIYFNPHLGPPSAQSLAWMFSDVAYMRRYVPMGWLTFSGVYQFSGLSPMGYHAANLLLHIVNTVLVYGLLLRLGRRFGGVSDATGAHWNALAATLGAAVWALHPFRAETVGWSSGLLYGAAGSWALLSGHAYLRTCSGDSTGGERTRWLGAAAVCYAMSILTYPVGIALVLVFFAIDLAVLREPAVGVRPGWRRLAVEKLVFLVPGVMVAAFTVFGRFEVSSFWPRPPTWEEFTLAQRVAQAFAVWAYYVWKTVWPAGLTLAPTWLFDIAPLRALFVGSGVFVIGLTAALVWRRRWHGGLLLWLAYLAVLTPLVGFTEHPHFASDRYSYLAGVLISVALVLGLLRCRGGARVVMTAIGGAAVVVFGVQQHAQLRIWQDTDTLMARTIEQSGDVDFSADNYRKWALFHAHRGEIERAREISAHAERFAPRHAQMVALRRELPVFEKTERDQDVDRSRPTAAKLHAKLALDFSRAGRAREAHEHFAAARRLAPESGPLAFNWAVLCATTGDPWRALHLYHGATAENAIDRPAVPARVRLLSLIAEAFFANDQPVLAMRAAEAAVRVAQADGDAGLLAAPKAQLERFRGTAR